jgi:hypothetical protein
VAADAPGGVGESLAGQRQRGRAEKHLKPPWRTTRILVDRFIYQGFAMRQGDTPYLISPNAILLHDPVENAQ